MTLPIRIVDPANAIECEHRGGITRDRLTMVFHAYHEHPGTNPDHVEVKFSAFLDTEEQVWHRRLKVEEAWQHLNLGWLDQVGYLIIEYPKPPATTLPENTDEAPPALYISPREGGPGFMVRPGGFFVGEPEDARVIWIRSGRGPIQIMLHAMPR